MKFLNQFLYFVIVVFCLWSLPQPTAAQVGYRVIPPPVIPVPVPHPSVTTPNATGYYPFVIARPQDRQVIRSMPIEQRPTRPMHFYGNRVRKSYSVGPTNRLMRTSRPIASPVIQRRW